MNLEININDYLCEDEIKNIVEDEIRKSIYRHFNDENNIKRILSNVSYELVFNKVDEIIKSTSNITEDTYTLINNKVIDIINNLSEYSVFRQSNIYGDKESEAQCMLRCCVESNKDLLKTKVKEIIDNYNYSEIKNYISDMLYECIMNNFKEAK